MPGFFLRSIYAVSLSPSSGTEVRHGGVKSRLKILMYCVYIPFITPGVLPSALRASRAVPICFLQIGRRLLPNPDEKSTPAQTLLFTY